MLKRIVALLILCAVVLLQPTPTSAAIGAARRQARVRDAVATLGCGPATQVSVDLGHGLTVRGYIASADETAFTVVAPDASSHRVTYGQVKGLKGRNAFTGQSVVITAAVIAAIVLIVAIGLAHDN